MELRELDLIIQQFEFSTSKLEITTGHIPIGGEHSLYSCFLENVLIKGAKSVLMTFDFVFNVLFLV